MGQCCRNAYLRPPMSRRCQLVTAAPDVTVYTTGWAMQILLVYGLLWSLCGDQGMHAIDLATPLHIYKCSGSVVIEQVTWTQDTCWLAVGTRKETVQVLPVRRADRKASPLTLERRVKNVDKVVSIAL